MIYPPPHSRRPQGRASATELAVWITGMAAFAAAVLVAAGVEPPFRLPTANTPTATPSSGSAWPTAVVPLPSGGLRPAPPLGTQAPEAPTTFPSPADWGEVTWPTAVPSPEWPTAPATATEWSAGWERTAPSTLPPQASPQWGRPLPSATPPLSANGTPSPTGAPTGTPPGAYP